MVLRAALRLVGGRPRCWPAAWHCGRCRAPPRRSAPRLSRSTRSRKRSPNYPTACSVNIEPASTINLDREQQFTAGRANSSAAPTSTPRSPSRWPPLRRGSARADSRSRWYGHSRRLDRGRRLPRARRSGVESTGARRRVRSARSGCIEVPVRWTRCPPSTRSLISHDHYDHLDIDTIKQPGPHPAGATFFVPLGIGAHLRKWGIPDDRIVELDWNESHRIGELTLVCTPARHFSGRLFHRNTTLWASWVIDRAHVTARSSAATPGTPRASPRSARTMALST